MIGAMRGDRPAYCKEMTTPEGDGTLPAVACNETSPVLRPGLPGTEVSPTAFAGPTHLAMYRHERAVVHLRPSQQIADTDALVAMLPPLLDVSRSQERPDIAAAGRKMRRAIISPVWRPKKGNTGHLTWKT